MRSTKIVATIGPASRSVGVLERMIRAGMDVARLNFAHETPEEHAETVGMIRQAAEAAGREVAVLQDIPGPKLRIGPVAGGVTELGTGTHVVLTPEQIEGTSQRLPVAWPGIAEIMHAGDVAYLADGAIRLRVTEVADGQVLTEVEVGGTLASRQGLNLPNVTTSLPAVSEEDLRLVDAGVEMGVDLLALSFVRRRDDLEPVKERLGAHGRDIPVIAKIEKPQAAANAEEIVRFADGIMVARGDLGIEVPLEQVPMIQKDLIARCNRASKPVVTATQMLESMTFNSRPTRAETTDVANAILDGTDAVMLSGETARGQYPIEAVRVMAEIAREVEKQYPHEVLQLRRLEGANRNIATSIAEAATRSSAELNLPFIVTGTTTGNAAHHISAFRPKAHIIALTPVPEVARRLALLWGIESILIERYSSIDVLLHIMEQRMLAEGLVERGECVAFTTGMTVGRGGTNLLKIHEIT
jgi:pyruvate kinase